MKSISIAAAAVLLATPAFAHVVVAPTAGPPGTVIDATFKAGHGCGDKPTTAIRVEVPAEVPMVHPHEVKGWKIATEKAGTRVTAVTWTAGKGADPTAALSAHVLLPDAKGPVYFTAVQTCGTTEVRWDETPKTKVDKHPAPSIEVGGAASPAGDHAEHHH